MARPMKCRWVCRMPRNTGFDPITTSGTDSRTILLTVDEYETVRLIDQQGASQEECGSYMRVARTTVQQIYTSARKKIAEALVEGLPLRIQGGEYRLCEGQEEFCRCRNCWKTKTAAQPRKTGGTVMKIAIPLDENKTDVCVVLSRAPYFLIVGDTEEILENPGADAEGGAGLKAAQFLVDQNITALVTVRCGQNAADVLTSAEVKIYEAQGTDARENIQSCREEKLAELTHFHAGFHGIR